MTKLISCFKRMEKDMVFLNQYVPIKQSKCFFNINVQFLINML